LSEHGNSGMPVNASPPPPRFATGHGQLSFYPQTVSPKRPSHVPSRLSLCRPNGLLPERPHTEITGWRNTKVTRCTIAFLSSRKSNQKLEGGPMPNVIAVQPNIGGALCESSVIAFPCTTPQSLADPAAGVPCSNAANIAESKTCAK